MSIYCVYLTTYSGNKLPPFYIGSSSVARVHSGYRGTVMSKRYKSTWLTETAAHPHLFKTHIIGVYENRADCLRREFELQRSVRAVASPMYINESYATQGVFGRSMTGSAHPLYGKPRPAHVRTKISANHADVAGSKNTNSKHITIICPSGDHIECYGNFKVTCRSMGLPYSTMCRALNRRVFPSSGPCVGYDALYHSSVPKSTA